MAQITIHGANGDIVEVIEGQLHVLSTIESELEHVSEHDSLAFSWDIVPYNSTSADTVIAVQNTSDSLFLHIERIIVAPSGGGSEFTVHTIDSPSALAGTALVGNCSNRAAAKVAAASAKADETGNVSQGLTHGSLRVVDGATGFFQFGGSLILGKSQMLGVDQTTGTTLVNCTVIGYYKTT